MLKNLPQEISFSYHEGQPDKDNSEWNSEELKTFSKYILREMPIAISKASVQKNSKILFFVIDKNDSSRVFKSIGEVDHINILSKFW